MKRLYFNIGKYILIAIGLVIIGFVTLLTVISLKDYIASPIETLKLQNTKQLELKESTTYELLSWNMGYSGLGKEMDFFYDGGKQVRANEKQSLKYLKENLNFLNSSKNVDFIFLQEVDIHAKRSYYNKQASMISNSLQEFEFSFAKNYDVSYVPVPISNPMGKVQAGMMNLSKYGAISSERYAYPNIASWPDKLFLLDRCFILNRYKAGDKELVLMNTHNSYYVNDSASRMIELNIIKEFALKEYQKGNYVVIGGDWNKLPPSSRYKPDQLDYPIQTELSHIPDHFLKEWKWAFDSKTPSNRTLDLPLSEHTRFSNIDYFVGSPNVEVFACKTINLKFENSDHNPVYLKFKMTP